MKDRKNHVKFIIAFLTFYILLSGVSVCADYVSVNDIVNAVLLKSVPAAEYISTDENKYENYLIGRIIYSNPIVSHAAKNTYTTDINDPVQPENVEMISSNDEKATKKKTAKKKKSAENSKKVSNVFELPQMTGTKYSIEKLSDYDFLINNFYTVSASTVVYKSDLNPKKLMKKSMKISEDNSKPQILIYHTHSQERFADSGNDKSKSIVGVGNYLVKILKEQYGYNVIHLKDEFDMVNGVLDRHKAYDYAHNKVAQVLADNPSIELIIDLHRDGVNESLHFVTEINGKPTAKIMFFNGLSRLASIGEIDYLHNPYREDNLALSMQMKMNAEAYYPGFTRKNYLHAYEYNLSMRPKSMLIEAGAQTNTYQEELNAMEPLAVLLNMTIGK